MSYKSPERSPDDGPVRVARHAGGELLIESTTAGERTAIRLSEYNLARLILASSTFLGINLDPEDSAGIEVTEFRATWKTNGED
jgi:hypothetical protein